MVDVFMDAVAAVCPDIRLQQPWKHTEDPEVFRNTFTIAGVGDVEVNSARDRLALPSPDDWWRIVNGTGLRATSAKLELVERGLCVLDATSTSMTTAWTRSCSRLTSPERSGNASAHSPTRMSMVRASASSGPSNQRTNSWTAATVSS